MNVNRNSIYAAVLLAAVWVILRESVTVWTVTGGIVIGGGCVYLCAKLLPSSKMPVINPFRFTLYLLFLLGEVYLAGFSAIKLIIKGAEVEIVEMKTKVSSPFLRTILVNSITLVPGSVSLDLNGDMITVLWLKKKTADPHYIHYADELIKGKLERMLLKAEK